MAITAPATDFQSALSACHTAIGNSDWETAYVEYAKAEAANSALDLEAEFGDARAKRRESLDGLKRALDAAEARKSKSVGSSRFIKTKTAFGS